MRLSWTNGHSPFHFAEEIFDCAAVFSSNHQSVVAQYKNIPIACGERLLDRSRQRQPRRNVGNPLPTQTLEAIFELRRSITPHRSGDGIDAMYVKNHTVGQCSMHRRFERRARIPLSGINAIL